jgi:hypothetical protein
MTYEEALRLVRLPKWVVDENGNKVETLTLEQKYPMQFRLHLLSEADYFREYMLDVKQSAKLGIRLNFQLMDKANWGLARLDYNSNHKNPDEFTDKVPEVFHSHVGEFFVQKSHLHYHVEDFPPLAWALPLEETEIEKKQVENVTMANDFIDAFNSFAAYLNIQTAITINPLIL